MLTITLICATKGRPLHVIRRVPSWCRCGVDDVVIVDATSDEGQASSVERVCQENGARYLRFRPSLRNTVAEQRNLGAFLAATDWVLFQDDDDDIIVEFNHDQFERAAGGMDYLWDGKGTILVYHRRGNFLRLAGFPPDMVIGVGSAFSDLVRATSKGGLEGEVYRKVEPGGDPMEISQTNAKRAAAMFWYGLTYPRYLERSSPSQRGHALAL